MELPLKTVFAFCAAQDGLLRELFAARGGVGEAELFAMAQRHGGAEPGPAGVVERLRRFRLIEERPGETLVLELTRAARDFLSFLLAEHDLETPELMRAHLAELRERGSGLAAAALAGDGDRVALEMERLDRALEELRAHAWTTYRALLATAADLRANRHRRTAHQRFLRINDLWGHYLIPLRRLLEPDGEADAAFLGLEAQLRQAAGLFRLDGRLHAALTVTAARLARVRKDGSRLFDDAYGEILPLYDRFRRLDQVERGAVLLLDRLERSGVGALRLERRLPIASVTFQPLPSDADQLGRLVAILGYVPSPPPPLAPPEWRRPPLVLSPERVWARLAADLPLADLMDWVLAAWPEAPLDLTLAVFGELRGDPRLTVRPAGARRRYRHRESVLEAAPLIVEVAA
ncbi:MAG: hypothetical protein HQL40_18550 [Alphaproteobacteria bacterium]|nr:hypothetical protein [Alphaproteobacteria bacterium]MBF0335616.1 hypothetical protein [Alphaproteobacteria bacterium]MBF0374389.1 hypothetical protein [Alphaproteobacteria bacterium]